MRPALSFTCTLGSQGKIFPKGLKSVCFFLALLLPATGSRANEALSEEGVPPLVRSCVKDSGETVQISTALNPFYLRGDLDGDGVNDFAVLVHDKSYRGILLCLSSQPSPVVVGAGEDFEGYRSLDFFDAWYILEKGPIERGVDEGSPPVLQGEAIQWIRSEASSGLIYWDGKRVRSYQQGD